ncbi:uncharacterized protein LOC113280580 [Papaver somniferum]|uniref:uncharacterized protein LOC113280580 n=1 Tax=Papaver somniferum TaxID=3469 RepID=UPI000E6FCC75|nr:uncharacterized protein LOC113280580 [Papaver somniferum]
MLAWQSRNSSIKFPLLYCCLEQQHSLLVAANASLAFNLAIYLRTTGFAYGCLLFARANTNEAKHIANIIGQFSKFSGQFVNFDKSGLAFSPKVPNPIKSIISNIFQIKRMSLQDKYLGVPLLLQKNKAESFAPLMNRFSDRLAPWQSKFIAQPGKTTLTQPVLGTIASHHMVVFPVPNKMDAIQRNFWWNKKNGEKAKLAWRMLEDPDAPWAVLLRHKYFNGLNPINCALSRQGSWLLQGKDLHSWIKLWFDKDFNNMPTIVTQFNTIFTMWQIWKTRSSVVFDNLQVKADEIIMNIKHHMSDWLRIQGASPSSRRENTVASVSKIWKRPDQDDTKVNFDAAFCKYTHLAGIGLISRNFVGGSNGARGHCTRALDQEQAEALAAFEAIKWAKDKGITRLHLEGDSQRVINALNGNLGAVKWTNAEIVLDLIYLLNKFSNWKCSFTHREGSNVADTIAKKSLPFPKAQEWKSEMPSWLSSVILEDENHLAINA